MFDFLGLPPFRKYNLNHLAVRINKSNMKDHKEERIDTELREIIATNTPEDLAYLKEKFKQWAEQLGDSCASPKPSAPRPSKFSCVRKCWSNQMN
jgi:hypothetical protein